MSNLVKTQAKAPTSGVVAPSSTYFPTRPFGTEIAPTQGLGQTTQSASPASRSHSFGAVSVLPRVLLIVQPKLRLGPAKDKYEEEADQVAQQVVDGPTVSTPQQHQRSGTGLSRKQDIQRLSVLPATPTIPTSIGAGIQSAQSGGRPFSEGVRRPMERIFGADFRKVRIHTDARSDQLSHSIQADAFTLGKDIFFKQKAYNPDNAEGQRLIAHELTHVVQQTGSMAQTKQNQVIQRGKLRTTSRGAKRPHPYLSPQPKSSKFQDTGTYDGQIYVILQNHGLAQGKQTASTISGGFVYVGQTIQKDVGDRFIQHVNEDKDQPWHRALWPQGTYDYSSDDEADWPYYPRELWNVKQETLLEIAAAEQYYYEKYNGLNGSLLNKQTPLKRSTFNKYKTSSTWTGKFDPPTWKPKV